MSRFDDAARFLGACCLALTLAGCAYLPPSGEPPRESSTERTRIALAAAEPAQAQHIEQWLDGGHYGLVLATIEQLPPEHAEYSRWQHALPRIRARAQTYEQAKLARGQEQAAAGDLYSALQTFETGLEKFPQSHILSKASEHARTQRDEAWHTLQIELLSQEAQWLLTEAGLIAQSSALNPQVAAIEARARANQDARERVARKLARLGGEALRQRDLATAERLFTVVMQINPQAGLEQNLAEIRSLQQARAASTQQVERRRVERARQSQGDGAAIAAASALEQGALAEARGLLRKLRALEGNSERMKDMNARLDVAVNQRVERDLERGRLLYSRGAIDAALEVWRPLLALDPEHVELRANIERAERVQARLRQLRERETVGSVN